MCVCVCACACAHVCVHARVAMLAKLLLLLVLANRGSTSGLMARMDVLGLLEFLTHSMQPHRPDHNVTYDRVSEDSKSNGLSSANGSRESSSVCELNVSSPAQPISLATSQPIALPLSCTPSQCTITLPVALPTRRRGGTVSPLIHPQIVLTVYSARWQ